MLRKEAEHREGCEAVGKKSLESCERAHALFGVHHGFATPRRFVICDVPGVFVEFTIMSYMQLSEVELESSQPEDRTTRVQVAAASLVLF